MAERRVIDCDGCGEQNLREHARLFVQTDRTLDASGNGYEDEGRTLQLCIKCCEWALQKNCDFVRGRGDYAKNSAWLEKFDERRSRLISRETR